MFNMITVNMLDYVDQIMLEYIGVSCLQNVVWFISLYLYSSEDECNY